MYGMTDSLSMTPPMSPERFPVEEIVHSPDSPQLEDVPFCQFRCLGNVRIKADNHHEDSYWKSGFLNRMLEPTNNAPTPHHNGRVTLFGFNWSRQMSTDALDKLFCILRQEFSLLQREANKAGLSFQTVTTGRDGEKVRTQICQCLDHIHSLTKRSDVGEALLQAVSRHLHVLLLHTGRVSDLPSHHFQMPHSNKVGAEIFHCYLDLYWRLLAILHTLTTTHSGIVMPGKWCRGLGCDLDLCLYDQMLHVILWDLVHLANIRYTSLCAGGERASMFTCTCVWELWLLVVKLTEWRAEKCGSESFWMCFHHVLTCILYRDNTQKPMELEDCQELVNPPEAFQTTDPVGLGIWLIYNIAPLYTQTLTGHGQVFESRNSNYHDLKVLLKKLLAMKPSVSETVLRRHLRTMVLLTANWEPNTAILVTLWDNFYKRLNETFQMSSGRVDGLAWMESSAAALYDRCTQIATGQYDSLERETSFQLFLRLLSNHLGRLYRNGDTQQWKQFKGRIYSKFHAKRVQDLLEGGLYNLTSLFLTLAITADLHDVASKLVDFYDMLDISSVSFARRSVVWRGVLALMLVHVNERLDIGFLVDRMVPSFEAAVKAFSEADTDSRHYLWGLILLYMEGLQDVVETSARLDLSQHKLICPGIKQLLTVCSEHELRTCLSCLHAVIQKFRNEPITNPGHASVTTALQYADFSSALWRFVYSFVMDHAQTNTPPTVIGDMAASFCLLSLHNSLDDSTSTVSVFQYFTSSEKVNVSVSGRFLSQLLGSAPVMEHLENRVDGLDDCLVAVWVRLAILLPGTDNTLQDISRSLVQLKTVREVLPDPGADLQHVPVNFFKALEARHASLESWQEKMEFQKRVSGYFADVGKHVSPLLKFLQPCESVYNMYHMVGCVVKYCAKLIYVKQDVILPSLLASMIVPLNVMSPDKPLSPVFLNAVRDTLHLYIQGLSKLAYDRDPYIQRRLKDIITIYLPKYPLKSASMTTAVHPVVGSLRNSFTQQPGIEVLKFRRYIMDLILSQYLAVTSMKINPSHALGFAFVHEVLQRTTSSEVKAGDLAVILKPCLEYLLLLANTDPSWTLVLQCVQLTSQAYNSHTDSIPMNELSNVTRKFVNGYFKFSSTGVVQVIEKLALLLPGVTASVITLISEKLREMERKRGVGVDNKLRSQYYEVLKLLGEDGKEEISRLEAHTGVS
ncbi:protein MMS22-like [Mya arenaria]|uniref:protein MMS22-like n=1 Tax=Mya arenaria TaxID=6604 RepID=UPI0022E620BF|nr:protein MMS22-like [Mya arenaria]